MRFSRYVALPLFAALPLAQAQTSPDMKMPAARATASASSSKMAMADGVVQSVDASKGMVTLKHGEIANPQMPAMTMAYSVADRKILEKIKSGDKVKFHLEMLHNAPTVTHIEPIR